MAKESVHTTLRAQPQTFENWRVTGLKWVSQWLEEIHGNQHNHDFNKRSTEGKGMRRDDILKIMAASAHLQDGH